MGNLSHSFSLTRSYLALCLSIAAIGNTKCYLVVDDLSYVIGWNWTGISEIVRMHTIDWLSVSFFSVFFYVISLLYVYSLTLFLFPDQHIILWVCVCMYVCVYKERHCRSWNYVHQLVAR